VRLFVVDMLSPRTAHVAARANAQERCSRLLPSCIVSAPAGVWAGHEHRKGLALDVGAIASLKMLSSPRVVKIESTPIPQKLGTFGKI
jgi:hypothetical protein